MAALNHAMRNASGQGVIYSQMVAERLGVSSSDLECLDFIVTRGPQTAGDLAEATGLTTGAITGVIDRLEQAGFARRERDADDRRKVLVKFQPGAERRIMPLFKPIERASMEVLAGLSDKELALMLDVMTRLSDAANAAMAELREQPKLPAKPAKSPKR
ncbi:MarR family winged helix-turn-helix transcriptional regulator [Rhodoplanes sp. Z2-YC6860]|uniref:MarR family winged helix-turn-helix transcriptional regulator n=1 Tax=Rhodoplanes sp. Z2-YC6860 TaxID=674703 RepID=UPI0018DD6300|nr:MarR family transcriptional regulator [Rhodoplanes sp. Z2-YC6860]